MSFKYLSLFCGCGGFDLGLSQEKFECTAAYDINQSVLAVYKQNLPDVTVQQDLSREVRIGEHSIDVIISGSPCQGFSTAGKRRLDDPRNKLFMNAIEIALQIMPKVFIAENVTGILAGEHRAQYLDFALQKLQTAGYKTHLFTINCQELGMAQIRKRVIIIAWNTGKSIVFPKMKRTIVNIQSVLKNLPPDINNHDIHTCAAIGSPLLIASHIRPGQKLSNVRASESSVHTWHIPEVFGEVSTKEIIILEAIMRLRRQLRKRNWGDADPVEIKRLENYLGFKVETSIKNLSKKNYVKFVEQNIDLTHTFNGKYRRLRWEEPSMTVDTRFGTPRLFLHPSENRAFTVREAARLQGFPDDFVFCGSLQSQYEMVGNAVPPPLSKYIACLIRTLL